MDFLYTVVTSVLLQTLPHVLKTGRVVDSARLYMRVAKQGTHPEERVAAYVANIFALLPPFLQDDNAKWPVRVRLNRENPTWCLDATKAIIAYIEYAINTNPQSPPMPDWPTLLGELSQYTADDGMSVSGSTQGSTLSSTQVAVRPQLLRPPVQQKRARAPAPPAPAPARARASPPAASAAGKRSAPGSSESNRPRQRTGQSSTAPSAASAVSAASSLASVIQSVKDLGQFQAKSVSLLAEKAELQKALERVYAKVRELQGRLTTADGELMALAERQGVKVTELLELAQATQGSGQGGN